ncbi:2Fe-2S iron-sulfur cluster-binding protein [Variovorax sp. PBL-E5]|uniref:2Fe-2S iron-sulfur cluster-binding protein n=1 Tax=Variovorax sp. PBL-E5 TaxID=434014 RepID=UPI0013174E99|nr:2Fe-2S iron-sulfur cluster-binding protein [Variovorax sp. PBL-E5]VTU19588.1 TPADO reductase component [Variovorax sp. PBL-E5]
MSHRIAIAGSEISFDCADGQSLLDAALRAGIELPYSCRRGVCGNCAGEVLQGDVAGLEGASMRNETCQPDQLLLCMCTPRTDVQIRPASWHRIDPGARKRFTAKVFRNQLAASDVSVLQLRLPAGQRARFHAGQYLQLAVGDGSTRCYSMANAPHESDALTLHIRHVPGGAFSARVPQLQQGEQLEIELPFGAVALDEADTRPIVFVAGGTGFAPVKSILDDTAKRRIERPITLIWGARYADGIYMRTAIAKWQRQWPRFRFVAALSDGAVDAPDDVFAGRADEALAAHCPALAGHEVYCCGSPAMVAGVRDTAVHHCGLDAVDFHADVFVDGPAVDPLPAATA